LYKTLGDFLELRSSINPFVTQMTFLRTMEETVHQEDLLRHLLNDDLMKTDVSKEWLNCYLFVGTLSSFTFVIVTDRKANTSSSSFFIWDSVAAPNKRACIVM